MRTAVVAAWLLAHILKTPHSHAPGETPEEFRVRASTIATALAEEATPYANGQGWSSTELAAATRVVWGEESQMDRRIHAGETHPVWTQDHMLAKCGMQLHAGGLVPEEEWAKLGGTDVDSTRLCAKFGTRVLVAMARQCGVWNGYRANRDRVAMAFMAYASGGKCKPTEAMWARADKWLKLMADRPDKSPLKGFRRTAPAEVPAGVRDQAQELAAAIGMPEVKLGSVWKSRNDDKFKLVVERHAEGKIGVSVLVAE